MGDDCATSMQASPPVLPFAPDQWYVVPKSSDGRMSLNDNIMDNIVLIPVRRVLVAGALSLSTALHAGNPANPILFVTQVPIPEEVNTRDVPQSFMSVVSPFSNHLADTLHAGRGGSLWI